MDNIVSNNESSQIVLTAVCLCGVVLISFSFSEGKIVFTQLSCRHRNGMLLTYQKIAISLAQSFAFLYPACKI